MDSLRLVTSIRYSKDMLNAVNRMTYFLNPNWNDSQGTLPVVFFYLMSFRTYQRNEMNTSTMIAYDSSDQENENTTRKAITQVVADNCVAQPEECQMEILIPFKLQSMNYFRRVHDLERTVSETASGILQNPLFKTLMSVIGTSLLIDPLSEPLTEIFTDENLEQPDSLKSMADGRLPIRMKLPFGWKFTNGIITSLEMRKEHDEDGFMNASVSMMLNPPIMQVQTKQGIARSSKANYIRKEFGNELKRIIGGISGANA